MRINVKKIWKAVLLTVLLVLLGVGTDNTALAKSHDETILDGIYIGNIELSGMTKDEAVKAVNMFVDELRQKVVTFGAVDEHYVAVTAGDLGVEWVNQEVIEEAAKLGKSGNIVQRYKAIQDLKHGNKIYDLELTFDKEAIKAIMEEQCAEYDIPAQNASLKRENGVFSVTEGIIGQSVNVSKSLDDTYTYLTQNWDYQNASIDLIIDITQPKGNSDELSKVKDVLGTFTTSFTTSGTARSKNIENACNLINGTTIYPGEEFSTLSLITPFTEANGYYPAGSYLNGMVVESLGGGICQVSTTLYNAILLSELEVTERSNHSMIISYVEPSMDAAIAESSGKDFKFVNNSEYPVYIDGYIQNKKITFSIYGVETRSKDHKVRYESETLSTTYPDADKIIPSSSYGVGYVDVQSAHIGYTAQLWKVVEEGGTEISREVINKSTYKVSPRTATVGTSTSDAGYSARIQAAIASGSIDVVKAEAAAIKNEINLNAQLAQQQAQQQAELEAYYNALQQQAQQQ